MSMLFNFFYKISFMLLISEPKLNDTKNLTVSDLQLLMCDKYWFQYANMIGLFLLTIFVIFIGIFLLNTAKHVKYLNLICAMYLFFFLLLYTFHYNSFTLQFNLNSTSFVNLFIFTATITVLIFYFAISDVFFIQENTKIEFSLLILFIYVSSIYLISNKDFISIIILLECIAFSSYVLIGFERNNKFSTTSALQYLILASVPSGFFILGISLLYHNFGSFVEDYILLLLKDINKPDLFTGINNLELQQCWVKINAYYLANGISFLDWFNIREINLSEQMSYFVKEHWKLLNTVFSVFNPSLLLDIWALDAYWIENPEDFKSIKQALSATTAVELVRFQAFDLPSIVELFKLYKWLLMQQLNVNEQFLKLYMAWPVNGVVGIDGVDVCTTVRDTNSFVTKSNLFQYFATHSEYSNILGWFQMMALHEYDREVGLAVQHHAYNYYSIIDAYKSILGWFGANATNVILNDHLDRIYGDTTDFWGIWESQKNSTYYMWNLLNINFDLTYYSIREVYKQYAWNEYYIIAKDFFNNNFEVFKGSDWKGLSKDIASIGKGLNFNLITQDWTSFSHLISKDKFFFTEFSESLKNPEIKSFYNLYTTIYSTTNYYTTGLISIYLILLFIIINLGFKLTASPFHLWAPSVYGGAPLAALTFLSVFSKLTVVFFFIWLFIHVFESLVSVWQPFCLAIAFFSIVSSILGAFTEKIFKRFFVYSSMGHVGFMLIGISVLNVEGLKSTFDYLVIYIISSFIIWFIIMFLTKKTTMLVNLKGLSLNQPFLGLIFSITIFSLSGIPPMGGFFVKYEIFYSLLQSSLFFLAYLLLILTVVSFFYYLRLIKIIFFENNKVFVKNKFLNDIKLRLISYLFFLIPFFMLFMDNPLALLLKNIFINSL